MVAGLFVWRKLLRTKIKSIPVNKTFWSLLYVQAMRALPNDTPDKSQQTPNKSQQVLTSPDKSWQVPTNSQQVPTSPNKLLTTPDNSGQLQTTPNKLQEITKEWNLTWWKHNTALQIFGWSFPFLRFCGVSLYDRIEVCQCILCIENFLETDISLLQHLCLIIIVVPEKVIYWIQQVQNWLWVFHVDSQVIPGHCLVLEVERDSEFTHDIVTQYHVITMLTRSRVDMEIPLNGLILEEFIKNECGFALFVLMFESFLLS